MDTLFPKNNNFMNIDEFNDKYFKKMVNNDGIHKIL